MLHFHCYLLQIQGTFFEKYIYILFYSTDLAYSSMTSSCFPILNWIIIYIYMYIWLLQGGEHTTHDP